jgi:hypothetical protein
MPWASPQEDPGSEILGEEEQSIITVPSGSALPLTANPGQVSIPWP